VAIASSVDKSIWVCPAPCRVYREGTDCVFEAETERIDLAVMLATFVYHSLSPEDETRLNED